jgi:hypothetical protein
MSDVSRKTAEHAYSVTAFNYAENPVGSRDWSLFWRGWQAREAFPPAPSAEPSATYVEAMRMAASVLDLAAEFIDWPSRSPGLADECRKKRDALRAQIEQIGGGR